MLWGQEYTDTSTLWSLTFHLGTRKKEAITCKVKTWLKLKSKRVTG